MGQGGTTRDERRIQDSRRLLAARWGYTDTARLKLPRTSYSGRRGQRAKRGGAVANNTQAGRAKAGKEEGWKGERRKGGQQDRQESCGNGHPPPPGLGGTGRYRLAIPLPLLLPLPLPPPLIPLIGGHEMRATGIAPPTQALGKNIRPAAAHRPVAPGLRSSLVPALVVGQRRWGSRYPEPTIKKLLPAVQTPLPFPCCWPRAVDGSCADRVSRRDTGGGVREMMKGHGRGDHRNSLTVNHSCNEPAQRVGAGGLLWANFFPSTASSTRYAIYAGAVGATGTASAKSQNRLVRLARESKTSYVRPAVPLHLDHRSPRRTQT
jgi:hypothetical protein